MFAGILLLVLGIIGVFVCNPNAISLDNPLLKFGNIFGTDIRTTIQIWKYLYYASYVSIAIGVISIIVHYIVGKNNVKPQEKIKETNQKTTQEKKLSSKTYKWQLLVSALIVVFSVILGIAYYGMQYSYPVCHFFSSNGLGFVQNLAIDFANYRYLLFAGGLVWFIIVKIVYWWKHK